MAGCRRPACRERAAAWVLHFSQTMAVADGEGYDWITEALEGHEKPKDSSPLDTKVQLELKVCLGPIALQSVCMRAAE